MELETLKSIWNDQDPPPEGKATRDQLLALLQGRSRNRIARMRRNLRIEGILIILTYIPCILFYRAEDEGRLSAISWALALVFVIFWGYYYGKDRLLKNMQCVSCEVRSNLAGQVRTLRKYLRFYLWFGTLMTPLMIYVAWGIMLRRPPPAALLQFIVPFTIALYFINVWYVNKLYGRHVRKLQELLREMDEE
jgi:hypothetical protein